MELADIDLLDLDRFAAGPPMDWFAHLRENAPVYWHPDYSGGGFWAVSTFDDIVTVGRTPAMFSSSYTRGGTVVLGHGGVDTTYGAAPRVISNMDPPEHVRYRRLVAGAFTPRAMEALEPAIREATRKVLDEGIAAGVVDFSKDVAAKLPIEAIGVMLGVPEEDRHLLEEWTDALMGSEDPELSRSAQEVEAASVELFSYGKRLRAARLAEPGEDLMSRLLASEIDGDSLADDELSGFFALLVIAGAETSRNVISHGVIALLDEPDQYQQLVDDPSLVRDATEEILRWSPAVYYLGRHVVEDTELHGQTLHAGDRVAMLFASGDRDADKFENPDQFDIHRRPREHLALGTGPHICLGNHLARLEIRIAFEELVQRVPSIKKMGEPSYLRSNLAGGVKHLPVDLSSGRQAGVKA